MALVQELPAAHFDLLERLVFHLTRVALNEKSNRMGPNALAIVFAPCILRTSKLQQAQDSLSNVSRQTSAVESILVEQLRRVTDTMADIDSLDSVCLAYAARLGTLRSSKTAASPTSSTTPSMIHPLTASSPSVQHNDDEKTRYTPFSCFYLHNEIGHGLKCYFSHFLNRSLQQQSEERMIEEQLDELREEKAALAATLPSLARSASDEDLLSTDGDLDGADSVEDLLASSASRSDSAQRGTCSIPANSHSLFLLASNCSVQHLSLISVSESTPTFFFFLLCLVFFCLGLFICFIDSGSQF